MPLFKKGNQQEPLNYRLVSLRSAVCKIMENLITKNYVDYLEKKYIFEKQVGFRMGRLCVSNLLNYYTRITEKSKSKMDRQYISRLQKRF